MNQRRAQTAIAIVFAAHGTVSGSFATRVPWIQHHLDLSAGALGLALLAPAIGSIVAPPIATAIAKRFGTRAVTRAGLIALCVLLTLPALAVNLASLFGILLVFGIASGVADVSMKHQATAYERETGRAVISRLHGLWSIGTLIGAGIGIAATATHLDARAHLLATGAGLLLVAMTLTARLPYLAPSITERPSVAETPPPARRFTMPSKGLLTIGLVGFCAAFAEAAAHSWSSVYIDAMPGTSTGLASAGFAVFVASMAAARFSGDALVKRFGPVTVVRTGAAAAVVGMILVVTAAGVLPAMIGFSLIGLGIAAIVPVVVSAAGRAGSTPSAGVFTVVTMTYAACLASPGTMGGIAGSAGLSTAFAVTAVITVVIVVLAGVLSPAPKRATRISFTRPARIGAKLAVTATRPAKAGARRVVTLTRLARGEASAAVTHSLPSLAPAVTARSPRRAVGTARVTAHRIVAEPAPATTSHGLAVTLTNEHPGDVSVSFNEPAIERRLSSPTEAPRMAQTDTVELPRMPEPVTVGDHR
ncbi:MFS transporter [Stackebrandtia soli]|uniref:MFS transporter n=1 Tax=Stackebrandtia soli TaxID=1892856 RepID=UPI0039E85380